MEPYIGLRDVIGDDQLSSHKWEVDGSTMTYNNFASTGPIKNGKKCVSLSESDQIWTERYCSTKHSALCEAKPVSTNLS